ncbi:hypothetical protein [Mesorhizobium sp. B2-2-2]|uniref:hypothetical protein n=1 Tax=unclassified Mesorhizobium TaxID=325217 RepID=UPI0032B1EF55
MSWATFSAVINPEASMRIMYAGHMDEIGFIVHYIDDDGFLFFNTIGAPTSPPRSDNGSGSMVASGCKGLSGASHSDLQTGRQQPNAVVEGSLDRYWRDLTGGG